MAPENEPSPEPFSAGTVVAREAHRAAMSLASSLAPRIMALTVKQTGDFVMPGTPTAAESSLTDRLSSGGPVTSLADPEVGQDRLGASGHRPSTGGDVLAGSDVSGHRIAAPLEQACALEAARLAPKLANDLVGQYPDIAVALAAEHGNSVVDPTGPITPAALLCAEVAAQLTVALISVITAEMAHVPIAPTVARQ
ncbi:MAG: hypothetical protein JWL70_612 [Acidimicrobiia bacterium]|nr:hypothetical protein [Acidimicrobiia bacterium]